MKESDKDEDEYGTAAERRQWRDDERHPPKKNDIDHETADDCGGGVGVTQPLFCEHVVKREQESVRERVELSGNRGHVGELRDVEEPIGAH